MTIFLIILVAVAAVLFLPSKLGVLARGFYHLFVKDLSQTPEGAAAIYEEKIEQARDSYARSANAVEKIAGKLQTRNEELVEVGKQIENLKKTAELYAQKQQWDKVDLYDQQFALLGEKQGMLTQQVAELTPMLADAQKVHQAHEQLLQKLQNDKSIVITKIETNRMTADMYKELDDLRRETNLDKLMGHVKDAVVETHEQAVGARTVHQNKLSTQIADADKEARRLSSDSLSSQLRSKYQTQQPNQPRN